MYELKGIVKVLNDTQQVTDSFRKREFVVTDNSSQYPQDILLQSVQDNCDKLNDIKVGDTVTVKFNLRGREWTNPQGEVKYFNSLDAWFIQKGEGTLEEAMAEGNAGYEDDLPFI